MPSDNCGAIGWTLWSFLPPSPYETIASGEQAEIRVLYNEIDPARRWAVPEFLRSMASDINREIFLQDAQEQQESLAASSREIDLALEVLDRSIAAVERGNREEARSAVQEAQRVIARLDQVLAQLGPGEGVLQVPVERAQARLEEGEARLAEAETVLATPDPPASSLGWRRHAGTCSGCSRRWSVSRMCLPRWPSRPLAWQRSTQRGCGPTLSPFLHPPCWPC
ncbi:MAG: hypothetical protein M3P51_11985 [Chloroflexota bacterium]|nr:hypothetical protein [Chloroflexota bacterium]